MEIYNTIKNIIDNLKYINDLNIPFGKYKNQNYKIMLNDYYYIETYIRIYKNKLSSEILLYLYTIIEIYKNRMNKNINYNNINFI
jgi:hypothetical protein